MKPEVHAQEIPRVSTLSRDAFVQDWLRPQRPVIVTEELAGSRAVSTWTFAYLTEVHGNHPVLVEYYPTGRRSDAFTYQEMTLGDYLRRVACDPAARRQFYLADAVLPTVLPDLASDVPVPAAIGPAASLRPVVFIGHDTFSATHYHRYRIQAFLTQVLGEKHVTMFDARDLRCTYPHPWYGLRTNFSRVPMEFDDPSGNRQLQRYPKLAECPRWECTLRPGEMLFIPDHWMHCTAGPGDNISVTFFWDEPWRYVHKPGYARDVLAAGSKGAMVGMARVSRRLGIHRPLVNAAIALGMVPAAERNVVIEHIEKFGGAAPHTVNAAKQGSASA